VEEYAQRIVWFPARKLSHVATKKLCCVAEIPRFIVNATSNAQESWTAATLVQRTVQKHVNATLKLKFSYHVNTPHGSCVARKTTQYIALRGVKGKWTVDTTAPEYAMRTVERERGSVRLTLSRFFRVATNKVFLVTKTH